MTANCAPTYAAIAQRWSQMRISPPIIEKLGGDSNAYSSDRVEVERAAARELRIPASAFLHDSILSLEVAVHDSEALLESLRPFEVVGEGPQEVAAHVGAGLNRASHLGDKAADEADPALVVDFAVRPRLVTVGASILGGVRRDDAVVFRNA